MDYKKLVTKTKNLTLLCAEDDKKVVKIYQDFFKFIFKDIVFAYNGVEAVEQYKKQKFDLVLLDIEMPKMNGIEAAKEILSINKNQDIFFLTAYDDMDYLKDASNLGIINYLLKPLDDEYFFHKLKNG